MIKNRLMVVFFTVSMQEINKTTLYKMYEGGYIMVKPYMIKESHDYRNYQRAWDTAVKRMT
ncbi:MAG: hypothetical protein SCK28_09480, partial [Bacillota bacterium]|nr:hypothetical protein [Bacillota bacterium]